MQCPVVATAPQAQPSSPPTLGYWKELGYHVRLLENKDAVGLDQYFTYLKSMGHSPMELMGGTDKKVFSHLSPDDPCVVVLLKNLPELCFFLPKELPEVSVNRALAEEVYQDPCRLFVMDERVIGDALGSLTQGELEQVFNLLPALMKDQELTSRRFLCLMKGLPRRAEALGLGLRLMACAQKDLPNAYKQLSEAEAMSGLADIALAGAVLGPLQEHSLPYSREQLAFHLLKECSAHPMFDHLVQRFPEWHDDEGLVQRLLTHQAKYVASSSNKVMEHYFEFLTERLGGERLKSIMERCGADIALVFCRRQQGQLFNWLWDQCAGLGVDLAVRLKGPDDNFGALVEQLLPDFHRVELLGDRLTEEDKVSLWQAVCDQMAKEDYAQCLIGELFSIMEKGLANEVDFSSWKMAPLMINHLHPDYWDKLLLADSKWEEKWEVLLKVFDDQAWLNWFTSADFQIWKEGLYHRHPLNEALARRRDEVSILLYQSLEPAPELSVSAASEPQPVPLPARTPKVREEPIPRTNPKLSRWKSFKQLFTRS